MILPKRQWIALAAICLTLALCGAWAWQYLDDQRSAASAAADELAACRQLAQQISAARLTPAMTSRPGDITASIASAASQAGLPDGTLDHIDPGSTRRDPDGAAIQRQIDLSLRQATLPQIITFTRVLALPPVAATATRLKLTPSDSDGGGWSAQITLTYPLTGDLK